MADQVDIDEWVEGVFLLEQAGTALGGEPDRATGAGYLNIPLEELTKRTRHLYNRLSGQGAVAVETADFNALTKTGFYRGAAGATGHPNPGSTQATVLHIEGDAGEAWQTGRVAGALTAYRYRAAVGGAWTTWDAAFTRQSFFDEIPGSDINTLYSPGFYNGRGGAGPNPTLGDNPFPTSDGFFALEVFQHSAFGDGLVVQIAHLLTFGEHQTVKRTRQLSSWTPWQRLWYGGYAESEAIRLIGEQSPVTVSGETGSMTMAGNAIVKWGRSYVSADQELITFDLAFPTACLNVVICDGTQSGSLGSAVRGYGIEFDTLTAANFRVRTDGDVGNVCWQAIGY